MTQRIALVTGAMGGIGTAVCVELAKAGHKVVAASVKSTWTPIQMLT